jgi:light-regulated signal transduction histidine kinase (bacteriophytochrome)
MQEDDEIIERLKRNERIEHFETVRLTKSGNRVDISLSVAPLVDASGRVVGGAKIAHDITAQKRSEEVLHRYARALERSNSDLEDFAYTASHDLKEPLRGLSRNATFLEEDYGNKLDADGVKRLGRIRYLAQRMDRLIDTMLSYARLGRKDLTSTATDLNEILREAASLMETTLEEQNATIKIPAPLPELRCDKDQVIHIFLNLLSNAVKYNNKEKKLIEVGYLPQMRTKNGFVQGVFYVRDNGEGIEEKFYEAIFRIFKRLNNESFGKKGDGVGLTFTRKIIDRHGGQIWLESQLGQGTTFYFTLPQDSARDAAA